MLKQKFSTKNIARTLILAALTVVITFPAMRLLAQDGPGLQDGPGFGPHMPPMERNFGPKGEHARWWNEQTLIEKLKLTDDQRKQLDNIFEQHRLKLVDLRASVEKAELSLHPLMEADQPNEAKILEQIDHIADARKELEKANARFLLAVRAQLTPEQRKTLETIKPMPHERGEHPGLPGPRPGGKNGRPGPLPEGGPSPNGQQEGLGETE